MRLSVLALALFTTPTLAQNAVTLTPGHPDLTLPAAPPASGTTEVRMIEPQAQSLGTIVERTALDGDVLTVVTRTVVPMAGANSVDSTRLVWPSLAPLSNDVTDGDDVAEVAFADGTVSGTYDAGRGALPFGFDLETPVFAPGVLPLLVRSIPLETGYTAVVPLFSAKDRFKEARLTVTGREDVEHDGETVSAWVVEQRGGGGLVGTFVQRHFIDPDTRALLHTEVHPQSEMLVHLVPLTAAQAAAREQEMAAAAAEAEAARAAAADLRPGAEVLATDAVRDASVEAVIRLVEPMQQDAGTDTRTVTIDEAAGTVTVTQVVDIPMAGQHQESTIVAAYPSLAPISVTETGANTTAITFADGRVTGTHDGEPVEADLDAPVFASGLLVEVVRLLPFAEGYSAGYRAFSAEDGVVTTLLTVTGQETVGDRTAWAVTAEREGNPTFTFHVDAETRELLRYGFSPQAGVRIEIGG